MTERAVFLLPDIPEDAPALLREGLARRRITSLTGRCPCGATMRIPNRAERRAAAKSGVVMHVAVEHEDDCPAVDDVVEAALRGWHR